MRRWRSGLIVMWLVASAAVVRADLWTDLGTQESEARMQTVQTILNGSIPGLGTVAFRRAAPAMRVALIQQVGTWAKTFTKSLAFKTAYDTARTNEKPEPPNTQTASAADQLKQQREEFEKSAAEMRKNAAGQSKEVRDTIETTIAQMRTSLDAMANNKTQLQALDKAYAQANAEEQQSYMEKLATFDREHPAAAQTALARRLQQFLDVCKDVDFNTQLVEVKGLKKFANPAFEAKSNEWKKCYRAGREPVEAARTFAIAWLKELGQ